MLDSPSKALTADTVAPIRRAHAADARSIIAAPAARALLVVDPAAGPSPLFGGREAYDDGWRAALRAPQTLPHFQMVLHRAATRTGVSDRPLDSAQAA
jgi:hypothetical protein